jgi:hypothetical protein
MQWDLQGPPDADVLEVAAAVTEPSFRILLALATVDALIEGLPVWFCSAHPTANLPPDVDKC